MENYLGRFLEKIYPWVAKQLIYWMYFSLMLFLFWCEKKVAHSVMQVKDNQDFSAVMGTVDETSYDDLLLSSWTRPSNHVIDS